MPKSLLILSLLLLSSCQQVEESVPQVGPDPIFDWSPSVEASLDYVQSLSEQANNQMQMNRAASTELELLDAKLFMTSSAYLQICDKTARQSFIDDHFAWLERRTQAADEVLATYAGGSMAGLAVAGAKGSFTRHRISEIERLIGSADSSCALPETDEPEVSTESAEVN